MTQREIDRQVARATGETVAEIRRRGFILLTAAPSCHKPPASKSRRRRRPAQLVRTAAK